MFDDLREFIKRVDELGECRVIKGADWNLELSRITELSGTRTDQPLLVFDEIKGYAPGYRVVTNFFNSYRRFALAHDLSLEATGVELIKAWRQKMKAGFTPVPPVVVATGPVTENVHLGADVDLWEFPTPKWHEIDGGRYIGTGKHGNRKRPGRRLGQPGHIPGAGP